MTPAIRIINARDPELTQFLTRQFSFQEEKAALVSEILSAVRQEGDRALCMYTARFDGVELSPEKLKVEATEQEAAYHQVDGGFLEALRLAGDNITAFHRKQLSNSWLDLNETGVICGQIIRPLARAGVYVPGGSAAYPSSVLMNVIPARVAGVAEIVMVTPPCKEYAGGINPYTLVAAVEAGVTEIYRVGGAQAIAALAYGTLSIKAVDKITGPGNIYVTLAKQQVYGQVGIDMLAGPSEVAVVADGSADPAYIAADLLSQAEHDPLSAALLFTPEEVLAHRVQGELARQLPLLPRKEIAARALAGQGAIVITADLEEAVELVNRYAPEHLELLVADPFFWLTRVENAGAVFLGHYSPEPAGDYLAGPNHILPTGGTARFSSPLGVDAFLKKSSVISYSRQALEQVGEHIIKLARLEGLDAHAKAVELRVGKVVK